MRLHLGPDIANPTIAVTLSTEEQAMLKDREDYKSIQACLERDKTVTVVEEDGLYDMMFLLRKIGRRPKATRERRLQPLVDMLDMVSMLPESPDSAWSQFVICSERVPDGRLALGMVLNWPNSDEKKIGNFATTIMRRIGRDLMYHTEFGLKEVYEQSVYAWLNRSDDTQLLGVSVQSDPLASAGIETIGDEYDPSSSSFRLECHNIYSYKQQLICLAGAIAIARSDELVTT